MKMLVAMQVDKDTGLSAEEEKQASVNCAHHRAVLRRSVFFVTWHSSNDTSPLHSPGWLLLLLNRIPLKIPQPQSNC